MKYYAMMLIGVALFVLPLSYMYAPVLSILGLIMAAAGAIQCDKHDKEINESLIRFFNWFNRFIRRVCKPRSS